MTRNKWPVAIAAGAFSTALIGGAALAGFQPVASADGTTIGGPITALTEKDQPKDRLKAVLDGLVAKNTITQAQEDAVLQAVKDAAPTPNPRPKVVRPTVPNAMSFVGDLTKATSGYLGMDLKTLVTQLRGGTSVADVANGLSGQGKSAQGLIDTLTKAANDKVDQAVAASKLTADQAAALKTKIATEITTFVNRRSTKPLLPRPLAPVKPTPSP